MKERKYFIIILVMLILYPLYLGVNNYNANSSDKFIPLQIQSKIWIEDIETKMEGNFLHIDIHYPQAYILNGDNEVNERINTLLKPSEIQWIYDMIKDGTIKISNAGEFSFDSSYTYENKLYARSLSINCTYTLGYSNEYFLNLYERNISHIRTSDWNYGAKLINMKSGERIKPEDFFDINSFRECIMNDVFEVNFVDFDIKAYFDNIPDESLPRYLSHIFINQNAEIEVIVIYGEGYETVIKANIKNAKEMIKPDYLEYFADIL